MLTVIEHANLTARRSWFVQIATSTPSLTGMAGAQRLRPSGFKKADSNRPDRPASGTGLSCLRMEAVTGALAASDNVYRVKTFWTGRPFCTHSSRQPSPPRLDFRSELFKPPVAVCYKVHVDIRMSI